MALYKKQADKQSGEGLALTEWNDLSSAVAGSAGLTLAINPTDKIGIGTSNPTAKLEIVGDIKANGNVSLEPGNTVSVNYGPWTIINRKFIAFQTNYQGDANRGQVHLYAPTNYYTNVPAITLAGNYGAGGNVGIGTTTPAEKLDVEGNVKAAKFIGDGSQLTNLSMGATGLNLATTANSKVGIGTTNPTAKLDIDAGGGSNIGLKVNGRIQSIGAGGLWVDTDKRFVGAQAADKIGFFNTAWHLVMGATGNVGLGTTGPAAKLHVINAETDAHGNTLILGPTSGSNLRLGYHKDYSWIQSHGLKPLQINPLGNNIIIGNRIVWDGGTGWKAHSDERLKTNIDKEKDILPRLMQLDVKNYNWKDDPTRKLKLIGFMAQDVKPLFPSLVGEMEDAETNETNLNLEYASFGVLAVGAIKELKQEYDKRIAALEAEVAGQKKALVVN